MKNKPTVRPNGIEVDLQGATLLRVDFGGKALIDPVHADDYRSAANGLDAFLGSVELRTGPKVRDDARSASPTKAVFAFPRGQGGLLARLSRPLTLKNVPPAEVRGLRAAVEKLDSKIACAKSPNDKSTAKYLKKLLLPDPDYVPEFYRLNGLPWRKRLMILWGIEMVEGSSIPPAEAVQKLEKYVDPLHAVRPFAKAAAGLVLLCLIGVLVGQIGGSDGDKTPVLTITPAAALDFAKGAELGEPIHAKARLPGKIDFGGLQEVGVEAGQDVAYPFKTEGAFDITWTGNAGRKERKPVLIRGGTGTVILKAVLGVSPQSVTKEGEVVADASHSYTQCQDKIGDIAYSIRWGDGSPAETLKDKDERKPHRYMKARPEPYIVRLRASAKDFESEDVKEVRVFEEEPPPAPPPPTEPMPLVLLDTKVEPSERKVTAQLRQAQGSSKIKEFVIDWGDRSPQAKSSEPFEKVEHVYDAHDSYEVSGVGRDSKGRESERRKRLVSLAYPYEKRDDLPDDSDRKEKQGDIPAKECTFAVKPTEAMVNEPITASASKPGTITFGNAKARSVKADEPVKHGFDTPGDFKVVWRGGKNESKSEIARIHKPLEKEVLTVAPAQAPVGDAIAAWAKLPGTIKFGDRDPEEVKADEHVTHSFDTPGEFVVTWTGEDHEPESTTVRIHEAFTKGILTVSPGAAWVNEPVKAWAKSPGTITFDMGDHKDAKADLRSQHSSSVQAEQRVEHKFGAAGDFRVTWTGGDKKTESVTVHIQEWWKNDYLAVYPVDAQVGEPITAIALKDPGTIRFGNGKNQKVKAEESVVDSFPTPGDFEVAFFNEAGAKEESTTVRIRPRSKLILHAALNVSPREVAKGIEVTADASASCTDYPTQIGTIAYTIDWGDASEVETLKDKSVLKKHCYEKAREEPYMVTLTARAADDKSKEPLESRDQKSVTVYDKRTDIPLPVKKPEVVLLVRVSDAARRQVQAAMTPLGEGSQIEHFVIEWGDGSDKIEFQKPGEWHDHTYSEAKVYHIAGSGWNAEGIESDKRFWPVDLREKPLIPVGPGGNGGGIRVTHEPNVFEPGETPTPPIPPPAPKLKIEIQNKPTSDKDGRMTVILGIRPPVGTFTVEQWEEVGGVVTPTDKDLILVKPEGEYTIKATGTYRRTPDGPAEHMDVEGKVKITITGSVKVE